MCGIFGILYHDGSTVPDPVLLQKTARILRHRGPDSFGVYADRGVGLVHTRLSLLDLNPRSDQPFWDQARKYCLLYNGEVYNFKALKTELQQQHDAVFITTSDTEVILESILRYGLDSVLPRLEGMFAFALWDSLDKSLTLVRDRFGIKPLYFYRDDEIFLFSSEIKGMAPWMGFEVDYPSVSTFLHGFGGPTKNFTFFKDVRVLPPGAVMEVSLGKPAQERRFFSLLDLWSDDEVGELQSRKPQEIVDRVEQHLFESVRKQLFADAPVGAFCSGGIDSSLVMAMASRLHSNLAIFHAEVEGPLSEYEAALALSKHLKLDLKSVSVRDQDFIDLIPDVIRHYEYPFSYHPNSVPFLLVSRLVETNNVKAVLTGEGADECFLGYAKLAIEDVVGLYREAISMARHLVRRIPSLGPVLWPYDGDTGNFVTSLHNRFEVALEESLTRGLTEGHPSRRLRRKDLRTLDLLGYHLRTLLHRNDALGMAASIEARFPYLDHELVRMAVNMPYNCKIRFAPTVFEKAHPFLRDKWVLRKVADRYLPRKLSQRKKLAFATTAFERMRIAPPYFRDSFVADLFGLGQKEMEYLVAHSPTNVTMNLMLLDVWGRLFFNNEAEEAIRNKLRENIAILGTERVSQAARSQV